MTRAAVVLLLAGALFAQDPPTRVGRVSFLYGAVSYRPSTTQDWADAVLNLPLSDGDHLFTDRDAQAEVRAGAATVHLAPQTGISIARIDERAAQLSVSEGAVNIRIARLNEDERVEVATPNGAFRLLRPGSYRVDVVPAAGYTSIAVRSGLVEAEAGPQTASVMPGQRLILSGNPASLAVLDVPPADPWDEWCAERDDALEGGLSLSEAYVDWELPGVEELAANGDWETDADNGAYWSPTSVSSDWAPFHRGRWIHKAPWGWTWVDEASWAFAPSHFGRWTKIKHGWAWIPGHRHRKEPYSPATVAFTPSPGRVAWTPLAPGETVASAAHRNRAAATSADAALLQPPRPPKPVKPPDIAPPRPDKAEVQAHAQSPATPVQRVAVEDHRSSYTEPAPAPPPPPPTHVEESRHPDPAPVSRHVDDSPPPPPVHHASPPPPPAPVQHVETRSTVQEHRVETPHHTEASRSTSSTGSRK